MFRSMNRVGSVPHRRIRRILLTESIAVSIVSMADWALWHSSSRWFQYLRQGSDRLKVTEFDGHLETSTTAPHQPGRSS